MKRKNKTKRNRQRLMHGVESLESRKMMAVYTVDTDLDGPLNGPPTGLTSLRMAVDEANKNPGEDTIRFAPEVFTETNGSPNQPILLTSGAIAITDSVKIEGLGRSRIRVDAQDNSTIFDVDDDDSFANDAVVVTLNGLHLTRGRASNQIRSGGAIVSYERLILNDVQIDHSVADRGGGIYSYGPTEISDSLIQNNTTSGWGGGIMKGSSSLSIHNTRFWQNSAGLGGAIFGFSTDLTIDNSAMQKNCALESGGAIYFVPAQSQAEMSVTNSLINQNAARQQGGGIWSSGKGSILGSEISENTALSEGGGIYTMFVEANAQTDISTSTVAENKATFGAGIYVDGRPRGLLTLSESTIRENVASDSGGGIWITDFGMSSITDSQIIGNSSAVDGGGIGNQNGEMTITRSVISQNNSNDGGGIHQEGASGVVRIVDTTISGNAAAGPFAEGAGILVGSGTAIIDRSTIDNNLSDVLGAGIEGRAESTISISSSTISNNRAFEHGAGIFAAGKLDVTSSTITRNQSGKGGLGPLGGAGIFTNSASPVVLGNTIVAGNHRLEGETLTADDLVGSFNGTYNLVGTNVGLSGLTNGAAGNRIGTAGQPIGPRLAALANNGGPRMTSALLPGSPAINAGSNLDNSQFDQRGTGYLRQVGSAVDIGAFENQTSPQNTVLQGTIGAFTGGDPGEGLDLIGAFAYAINVGGPAVTVGDARFTAGSEAGIAGGSTPGATITDANEIADWHTADYGSTAADNSLESVMKSIRWNTGPVQIDLQVTPNQPYKLQLLFAESCCDRGFGINVEGEQKVDNFNVQLAQGGINNGAQGVVFTDTVVSTDGVLNIVLVGPNPWVRDNNPILSGLTLETNAPVPDDILDIGLAWGAAIPTAFSRNFFGELIVVPGTTPAAIVSPAVRSNIRQRVAQMFADSGIQKIRVVDGEVPGETNVYFSDRLAIYPGLLGIAYEGIDQFNRTDNSNVAVFLTGDTELDAEVAAHEIGHSLGLRHVNPPALGDPNNLEIMDYDDKPGDRERFINTVSEVTEPPDCRDLKCRQGINHNPLYHLKRYIDGVSHADLVTQGIRPGDWDLMPDEGGNPNHVGLRLDFGDFDTQLHNVQILTKQSDFENVLIPLQSFDSITIAELEKLSWNLPLGTTVDLYAASQAGGEQDLVLARGNPFEDANLGVAASLGDLGTVSLQKITDLAGSFETLANGTATGSLVNRIIGDSNDDGIFNSSDLIVVFQAGEYEDEIPDNSTFNEGDWNGDGDFDSGDLVAAFQAGTYVSNAAKTESPFIRRAAAIDRAIAAAVDFDNDELVDENLVDSRGYDESHGSLAWLLGSRQERQR
jgi:hypothetical protein